MPCFPAPTTYDPYESDPDRHPYSTLKIIKIISSSVTFVLLSDISPINLLVSLDPAPQAQIPSQDMTAMMSPSTSACTSTSACAVATVEIQINGLSGSGVINLNEAASTEVIDSLSVTESQVHLSSVVSDLTSMPSYGFHPTWNASLRGTAATATSTCESIKVLDTNLPSRLPQPPITSADMSLFTASGLQLRPSLLHSGLLLAACLQIAIFSFF